MNSPLKKKVQKFSRLEEDCQSKIAIINSIKENKLKSSTSSFLFNRLMMSSQKFQEKPHELPIKQFVNISFDTCQQKTVIIKEKEIVSNTQDGKMFVIMIDSDFQIHATLIVNLNGYEKKVTYKVFGTKAIPINQYSKDDIKLILFAEKIKAMSQARLHLDLIKSSFQSANKFNSISPKKQKLQIEEYLKQNRGRSSQILRRRSETRQKVKRDRCISSAASFKTIFSDKTFDPTASFYNKRQKSQLHLFEVQKTKYMNHMKKMCPQKEVLLKRTESQYLSKKQQQVIKFTSLIFLSRFQKRSRLRILQKINERIKKIKISMLATDFCMLMKSKLRFKITQKARYRMAVRTPLAFLGDIFYTLSKPKADKKVTDCLEQIEAFKTLLNLSNKSIKYLQKLKVIQKYARKKRANMRQRANIILDQLMYKHYIKESELKQKRQVLIEKYLGVCFSEAKSAWTAGLYQKTDILLKMMTK